MQSSTRLSQESAVFAVDQRSLREPGSNTSGSAVGGCPQSNKDKPNDPHNKQAIEKPEKRPGRFRTNVRESWKALARALSLSLIVHALRGFKNPTGRGFHEPTKIAIRYNRVIALLRPLVHLVPFGFALFEIILNWNVYYVGTKAYNTALYQVVAKAHEILIQSSIAAVVFSTVRRDLALGKGLPFGMLFGGLQVSQISYLWSVELWGAMKAEFLPPSRKVALYTLLTGSVYLAVMSGPASAVLLIPRLQLWPAGHTHIWINATSDQIWPARVDGSLIAETCAEIETGISDACPASEWYVIRDWLSAAKQSPSPEYIDRYDMSEAPIACLLHGKNSVRQLSIAEDNQFMGHGPAPAIATTPQAVVSDALATTVSLWFLSLTNITANTGHGSALSDQSDAAHSIASHYSQPYSTAVCVPDRMSPVFDLRKVALPILLNANSLASATGNLTYQGHSRAHVTETIEHPEFYYSQLMETPGSSKDFRLRWIELPEESFPGSSIGAAILFPQSSTVSEQDLLLCNLAAGWGPSTLSVGTRNGGVGTVYGKMDKRGFLNSPAQPISQIHVPNAEMNVDVDDHFEFHYPNFPQRLINITESWAQYLNPRTRSLNTSLLNVLMQQQVFPSQQYVSASQILATLTVDGLARTSWDSLLQGDVKTVGPNGEGGLDGNYWLSGKGDVFNVDPNKNPDWVTFRVDSTMQGYAYNTLTMPPRIAIAILAAYCLLVVGHTLYSGITGISSNSWDTIAEITALAVNSTPAAPLRNTCAGITELHIFKLPVRVLVSKDEEGEGEHLELVFGRVEEEKMEDRTIKANRTYGTMPRGFEVEGKKVV